MVARGDYALSVSVAFGVLALGLLLRWPVTGLVLAWMVMILVPYGALQLALPVFDSPLMIVAALTLALGLGRLAIKRETLVYSDLYVPMAIWAGVLVLFALIGHGPDAATRAQWTLQGTWAFFLVVLVVKTPRQARTALLALVLPLAGLALLWTSGMISTQGLSLGTSQGLFVSRARGLWIGNAARSGFGGVLLGLFGTGGWQTFTMMAMIWPILFSVAINGSGWRLRVAAGLVSTLVFLPVLLSSYGNAILIVAEGAVFVLVSSLRRLSLREWLLAVILGGVLSALVWFSASGQYAVQRVLSGTDPSIMARQAAVQQGLLAFRDSPLIGWGAHNHVFVTPGGHYLAVHSSFVRAAYESGLMYLVPLGILLFRAGQNILRLSQKTLAREDRAILIGVQAVFGSYVLQGLVSGSMGIIGIDSVFWLCMGLVTVWLCWLDGGIHHRLIE